MRSNLMAAKLFMWILVLLTPITVGAFVYLANWIRQNKQRASPAAYNFAVMIAVFCTLGVCFFGFVLNGILWNVLPACLVTEQSCFPAGESNGDAVAGLLILVGLLLPTFLFFFALTRQCRECGKLGTLKKVETEVLSKSFRQAPYENDMGGGIKSRGVATVRTREMADHFQCTVCGARSQRRRTVEDNGT